MIIGSLLDAGLEFNILEREIGKLPIPGVHLSSTKVTRQSLVATKFDVLDQSSTAFRHLSDLNKIVDTSPHSSFIKEKAKAIFLKLAEAEAKCHGIPLQEVHFHEIGAADTIVDVVGALVGIEHLGIQRVLSSPLNLGSGSVSFSHGTYPVPAPATAELLRAVPVYSTDTRSELVTPTGAAILTTLTDQFGLMPQLIINSTGYGAGTRELTSPNVLRIFVGETVTKRIDGHEVVSVLETNIDDMNPQIYDHVLTLLLAAGALDAFLTPIIMKKGRPGIKLSVLCQTELIEDLSRIILSNTTSIGIRIRDENRIISSRENVSLDTQIGPVDVKVATLDGAIINVRPEYEHCRKHADRLGIPLKVALQHVDAEIAKAFDYSPKN